ncbi:MAG: diacylglycerol kinase [Thiomargarita sp.]|nr:diacylglycerol kinase [Thiomargarita sp.]
MATKSKNGGLTRIIKAGGYSLAGLRTAWNNEAAFRQEVLFCIILIPLAFWIGDNHIELILLISSLLLVLIAEIINSALEAIADRVSTEQHILIKQAKDLGSAAVFIALCYTIFIWGIILWF